MNNERLIWAECIVAMKKARDREDNASDSDSSISRPTNRGNKLKRKAKDISRGPLRQFDKLRTPVEKINYNGYMRDIVWRNPPRVDADGDAIDNPDEEDNAELTDAEENPYKDCKIEEILRPLTNAADLHKHPSMAHPYKSRAIDEMLEQIQDMVFREQNKLVRMQRFMTTLIGDNSYAPLGSLESEEDLDTVNAPLPFHQGTSGSASSVVSAERQNIWNTFDHAHERIQEGEAKVNGAVEDVDMVAEKQEANELGQAKDEEMHDADDAERAPANADDPNGYEQAQNGPRADTENGDDDDDDDESQQTHRMTTRSRVAPSATSPTREPGSPQTANSFQIPLVHPFFELSEDKLPAPPSGLPDRQAYTDLLRQVASYVQKQQEVVYQCNQLLTQLRKARRLRETVWQWCKAEGHVGEMSDGEDWLDGEQWGLTEPLRKGEEVEDEDETVQRRTNQRRARAGAGNKN